MRKPWLNLTFVLNCKIQCKSEILVTIPTTFLLYFQGGKGKAVKGGKKKAASSGDDAQSEPALTVSKHSGLK